MFSTTTLLTDTERRAAELVALVEGQFERGTPQGEYRMGSYVDEAFVDAFRRGRVRTRRDRVQVDVQFQPTVRNRSGVQLYSVVARWQPAAAPAPVTVSLNAPAAAAPSRGGGASLPVGRSWLT